MAVHQVRAQHVPDPEASGTSQVPRPNLPTWESFSTADRQRLVRAILVVAQHQARSVLGRGEPERGR